MLVVTHEVRFAQDVADRVVFMEGGVVAPAFVLSSCANGPTAIAIFPCRPLSELSSRACARGMSARE